MWFRLFTGLLAWVGVLSAAVCASASTPACHRPAAGSVAKPAPDLYSGGGVLNVAFSTVTSLDAQNRTLLCYVTPDGMENPTLHVLPGDTINVSLSNTLPKSQDGLAMEPMPQASDQCGAKTMLPDSFNIHFHGLNVSPRCHSDEVIRTLVNPGQSFSYTIKIPADEPPGMYWYHPHVHGIAHQQVEAGASGAIEVEGIGALVPSVANLPQRTLIMRDQIVDPAAAPNKRKPNLDLTLNAVPIAYPAEQPAVVEMGEGQEFWRFVNASADDIAVLQVRYDGVVQTLGLAAVDAVALGSQDGTRRGHVQNVTSILVPPGGRAEFTLIAPGPGIRHATLTTLKPDNGPLGDADPERILAVIRPLYTRDATLPVLSADAGVVPRQRFEGLDQAKPSAVRRLYFSEILTDPGDPGEGLFYITVAGQLPAPFDPNAPPAITTTQGAVEDWIIQNQTQEVHEFHMHQIHFQVRAVNGKPVPQADRLVRDTVEVPYWSGRGPYPSVTLRLDFRGDVVGDFVYHCHILDHEDYGMMQIVRVLPRSGGL